MKALAILFLTGVVVVSLFVWLLINMNHPEKTEKYQMPKRIYNSSIIE
ncbi:MAG: hypothetical protein JEY94_13600 [Melioribacteraceae bacterium]|nr:hypothetical protein [Melioribacteraceae bacterium]